MSFNKTQIKIEIPKGENALKLCLMIYTMLEAYNQPITSYTKVALNKGFQNSSSNQYQLHKYLIWSKKDNAWTCSAQDNENLAKTSLSDLLLILQSDKKRAVCALIFNPHGEILMVSRKDNSNDFGLPGGKVDIGESNFKALIREVLEETGLNIRVDTTCLIHQDGDYEVTTYLCTILSGLMGETEEMGVVKFGSFSEIVSPSSSFAKYNSLLLDSILQHAFCEKILKKEN